MVDGTFIRFRHFFSSKETLLIERATTVLRKITHRVTTAKNRKNYLGTAQTWNLVFLNGELVVVSNFLSFGYFLISVNHNPLHSINTNDLGVAVGLSGKYVALECHRGNPEVMNPTSQE